MPKTLSLASQDPRAAQPSLRFHHLERPEVPRRRHHHLHLRQVRHDLDAADHRPAALQGRSRSRGRRHVALARPAGAAQGGEAAAGRGPDAPALPEDPPAGRCAPLLAQGEVPLHRPRRPRRRVEHVQPSRERQPDLVRGAQRHAGPRRAADRAAAGRHPGLLARLDGQGRPSVLAVLGERAVLVGHSRPAQRQAGPLHQPEARHAGADPADRRLPRHPDRREELGCHRAPLLLRVDEGERHQERAAGRRVLGCRRGGLHQQGRERPLVGHAHGRRTRTEYLAKAEKELGTQCAHWLATGEGME